MRGLIKYIFAQKVLRILRLKFSSAKDIAIRDTTLKKSNLRSKTYVSYIF